MSLAKHHCFTAHLVLKMMRGDNLIGYHSRTHYALWKYAMWHIPCHCIYTMRAMGFLIL